ncbi:MAG: outer membrane protein assembly factor BamC [Ramlibacter sp.]|nr:outer membrane protein assembly factor BamC [Ramlibacter sp.]
MKTAQAIQKTRGSQVKQSLKFGLLALTVALSACSVLEGDKIDYKSAGKGVSLEVPPDLTQLSRDSRYVVPGGAVTASSYQVGQSVSGLPTAATAVGDVRIERSGNQRWLVINRSADQLWGPVRDFWQENGFLLALDQQTLGIMETDWAENRAKIPQDLIRNTLGKLIDSVYSTSERDRFRTRLERSANGGTEVYVSHRGMIEVYASTQKDQTIWQPRPTDPELEAEFLRRLMVKLGVPQEQSKALVASGAAKTTSRVATAGGTPVVVVDEGFDRAWRRVGLALDRTGFTVEDRDRTQGTYFVRYVAPNADKKDPGFFGKLLNFARTEKAEAPLKYRIALKSQGESTTVSVLNAAGAPETSANAQRIVQVIADDLK